MDWAWNELIYKANWDPASSISDDDFEFGGVEYTIHRIRIIPGIYPEMDNTWSRSFQQEAELQISIARGLERSAPSPDHYRDWTLYIDDVTLPLSQALQNWHEFRWYGAGIQNLFADWTPSTTNRIGIMRTPFADQPQAIVPGVPRLVDADSFGSSAISVHWWLPRTDGGSSITGYKVQWKEAGDSWTDAAAVSEKPADRVNALAGRATVTGLTGGTLYTVRVIATNAVGDSHPSAEMVARPQGSVPRVAESVVNGSSLTLRYDKYMNTSSVPATSSFVVMVNDGIRLVDSVTIAGREVRLTLSSAVSAADEVTWLYQEPVVTTAPALRDTDGNYAADRGRSAFQEADQRNAALIAAAVDRPVHRRAKLPRRGEQHHLQHRVQRVGLGRPRLPQGRLAGGDGRNGDERPLARPEHEEMGGDHPAGDPGRHRSRPAEESVLRFPSQRWHPGR